MACFHFKSCASIGYKLGLLPTRLVTEVPCGLAHHVGKVTCFHFKSCVSYTIANQTGFRGSLLPGCLAHHAGKKGLAFTARALLSLGLSQSIANRAGFGASLWLEESILTYAPFAPSSPHPVVFCCWTLERCKLRVHHTASNRRTRKRMGKKFSTPWCKASPLGIESWTSSLQSDALTTELSGPLLF